MRPIDADALLERDWFDKSHDEVGQEVWYREEIENAPTIVTDDAVTLLTALIEKLPEIIDKAIQYGIGEGTDETN